MNQYNLIIIGGGIAGLTAAIAWCKVNNVSQKPVLLIEKESKVGGCVTTFRRKGYSFDTSQIIPDPTDILDYLGVNLDLVRFSGNYCQITKVDPCSGKIRSLPVPTGYGEFRAALHAINPSQSNKIDQFVEYCQRVYREMYHLKTEPQVFDIFKMLLRCRGIIGTSNKTYRQILSKFSITDPDILEILSIFSIFGGLPPERITALMPIGALNATLTGAFRPKKGFIVLPNQMRRRIGDLKGHILTKSEVSRILTDDNGLVKGVRLTDGRFFSCRNIISTIDPKVTLNKLVDFSLLKKLSPQYAKKITDVKMSVSSITISLGLDPSVDIRRYGLCPGYNVLTTGGDTFNKLLRAFDENDLLLDENCFHLALISPTLTIGGKPVLILRVLPVAMGDWQQLRNTDYSAYQAKKERVAAFYIKIAQKYLIPDLFTIIQVKDIATPATFARYLGSPTGSNYDMAPYPDNFGRSRIKMRTPIKGLFIPKFSHGIWPSFQAGLQAVDMITGGHVMSGYTRYQKRT